MATIIAEHAVVDSRAEIDEGVEIGPFCVVGPDVRIGRDTRLLNGVTLMGDVTLGRSNVVYPGAVIGGEPQDLSYQGTSTQVVIGDHNVIREGVTINRATEKEDGVTVIGDHNYFMACSHIAHDCRVGSYVVLANAVLLGGHVHVDDHASLSGEVAVHHYARIGRYAFVGGLSRVLHDVPPYMLADGSPSRPRCINVVALKRNGFSAEAIACLAEAHRLLYRAKVGLEHSHELLASNQRLLPEVDEVLAFIRDQNGGRHGRARERMRAA